MRELAAIDTSKLGEHWIWTAERAWEALSRAFGWSTRRPGPLLGTMPRLAVALALCAAASAFQAPVSQPARSTLARHAEDPTKVWYADLANGVQNLLQNSPLNEGKKALVKALAGDYDEEATRVREMFVANQSPR